MLFLSFKFFPFSSLSKLPLFILNSKFKTLNPRTNNLKKNHTEKNPKNYDTIFISLLNIMSYDTKPKKKTNPHRMRELCDETSSGIGKFIFGNEGLQMEYFLLSWLTLLVFLNLIIYGFFLKIIIIKKNKKQNKTHHKRA